MNKKGSAVLSNILSFCSMLVNHNHLFQSILIIVLIHFIIDIVIVVTLQLLELHELFGNLAPLALLDGRLDH